MKEKEDTPYQVYTKENNSVGGLKYILTGSSIPKRIVWLVILLVCLAGFGYIVRNNFTKIVNVPTATTVSSKTETTLTFPAVTICNLNIFSAYISRNIVNKFFAERLGYQPDLVGDLRAVYTSNSITECNKHFEKYNHPSIQLEHSDFLSLAPTEPQDFIYECKFGGKRCNITTDFVPIRTRLGRCFTFNSGRNQPIFRASGPGVTHGLQLQLVVHEDDYVATLAGDAGIKIAVHDQSVPPLPDELGLAVPPGKNIFVSVRKRSVRDNTGINCRQAHDTSNWNFLVNIFNYSSAACIEDSFLTRVLHECGCNFSTIVEPTVPQLRHKLCNYVQICCIFDQFSHPVVEPCAPACSRTEYPISSVSYSRFPAMYVGLQGELSSDNSALASIFYETMSVETEESEFTYGSEEFLAEIGGHLGLFIGVSVISLFEFIVFVIDAVIDCLFGRNKKSKRNEAIELK